MLYNTIYIHERRYTLARTIVVTDAQADLVGFLLEGWLADFEEATTQVTNDRSFTDVDTMLDAVAMMGINKREAEDLLATLGTKVG
jgi:hypothetical protein